MYDLDSLVTQYELILRNLLDLHAPLLKRTVTARPHAPWFGPTLRAAKRELRRHERRWKSSKLEVHRQILREQSTRYKHLVVSAKTVFHKKQLEHSDSKHLFQAVGRMTAPTSSKTLSSGRVT